MDCKKEDDDLGEIQINDSFIPSTLISSFHQPEPRLQIRNPQEINQKASKNTSQTRRRSVSSSPEVQYEGTIINTNTNHSKTKKSRREVQRQDSSSSLTEIHFQGFPTRYSKMKLVKASLNSTSDGMMSYLDINREVMLGCWERILKSNNISGNSNNGFCDDESWHPQAPEFTERANGNERLRHPSHSSSTLMSPPTVFSPSDNFRIPFPSMSTSSHCNSSVDDLRVRSKNPEYIQNINSSSPLWNPDPPMSFSSPSNESRIPLRNPDPPSPSFISPSSDSRIPLRIPDPPPPPLLPPLLPPPPPSFRQSSLLYDPSSDLRNPDPPQTSFRQSSPPYDSRSELRNPDPPQASFREPSPRNPGRPHFNFQASYENRSCLTNPDPPQYLSQPSLEKNVLPLENRTCFTNPDPLQFDTQSSHDSTGLCEEPRSTNIESIASMINNIRNDESSRMNNLRMMDPVDSRENKDNKISKIHDDQGNLESRKINETIDLEIARRCPVYMKGFKCHKGEYCEKLHSLPRQDNVPCMYFKGEGCRRTATDCWFWHPGEKVNEFVVNEDAPALVPSMGDIVGYIRKEQAANPDKYKSKIIPSNEITALAKVVIPAAKGNANHTPLGQRQISRIDYSNHSPLLPHLKMANSTNIVDNLSNKKLPSPSTESNIDITSPSKDLSFSNSTENSSIEVSRIKLSKPAKVGAPRKRGVENTTDDRSNLASFKIPKKNSVKANSSYIINKKTSENAKTIETSKNLDISNKLPSQTNMENNINTKTKEILSNDAVKDNLIKFSVNDSKYIKSNKTKKDVQSSQIDQKEKEKSKKSKETNEKSKRKSKLVIESEEDSPDVNETNEKIQGKKSKMNNKKSNEAKRSAIESSEGSGEDSSQTLVSTNDILASSSDETISEKGTKKISNDAVKDNLIKFSVKDSKNIKTNKTKKDVQSSQIDQKEKEKSKKSKETNEKSNIKSKLVSECEEESPNVNETKEKIQGKKSKMNNKKSNEAKRSAIESSEGSGEDSSQTLVSTNDILASSSDETISEKGTKKSNMSSKKLKKSDIEISDESGKVGSKANVIKNKKIMSGNEKVDEILPKQPIKCNKKGKELKKSINESDKDSKGKNSKSVNTKDKKLKSAQDKENIQANKSKNSTKRKNKPRISRIESSSESETEPELNQNSATFNTESDSNIRIEEQNTKNNNDPKNTNIKVEKKEENKKTIVIEEISLLSDSDEDCNDAVVKSETFLSEEINESNTVRERKALDDILWGIDKELENLEEASGGEWKRTPNHIEEDLLSVLPGIAIEIFEDSKYPDIYNLDVNYRQLFLKISGIDEDVRKHALLCKIRYPNCKSIPKNHEEDMSCCR